MRRIFKYPLQITDIQYVMMPKGAEILSVAVQNEIVCLWALVNPELQYVSREIRIVGTGNPAPDGNVRFIGTVLMLDGQLVWHVFEELKRHME